MIERVLILAGGNGVRLGELTKGTCKPMVNVCGKPLVGYSLEQFYHLNIMITVGPFMMDIIDYCYNNYDVNSFVITKNKDNCWWLFNSYLSEINAPILVLPCDLIVRIDINFIYGEYVRLGCPPAMLVPTVNNYGHDGDYIISNESCVSNISKSEISMEFCSGIQIINPKVVVDKFNNIFLPDNFDQLWNGLISKTLLYCSETYPHPWYSINSESELSYYENNKHLFYK